MIGKVGGDEIGRRLRQALADEGVDVTGVGTDNDQGSGLAVITLDQQAENAIVVIPGANATLTPEDVAERPSLSTAGVVVAQLEIPVPTVSAAATRTSGTFILNAAPAMDLPPELLSRVDILVVNRSELATLTGVMADHLEWLGANARLIDGPSAVIVTLGAEGALLVESDEVTHVPAPSVETVDTTGAGDAFVGAVAARSSAGASLRDAVEYAVVAGALATTRKGAADAMPRRADIEAVPDQD
jgi:ribokinase